MNEIKEYRRHRQRGFNAKDYYIEPRWGIGDNIPIIGDKEDVRVVERIQIEIREKKITILYGFVGGWSAFEDECFSNRLEYLEAERERLIADHQTELARIDDDIKKLKNIQSSAKPT